MCKTALLSAGLVAGLALAVTGASTAGLGGANSKCHAGWAEHIGGCFDPIGDVNGAAVGPDIVRVSQGASSGTIVFDVKFAKGHPLRHSSAYMDRVSVLLTVGPMRQYRLTVSANNLWREVLRRLPSGKPVILSPPAAGWSSPKDVSLGVDLHRIGNPATVRYKVQALRVMHDGTWGSSDNAPDKGTGIWSSG